MSDSSAAGPQLGHMVYFRLKDNSPAAIDKLVASCRQHLSGHPGTVFFGVGTRDFELNREVNVQDFDVALQLVFQNRAAHDRYQAADRHQSFIAENKENWAGVRVFDAHVTS